MRLVFMALFLLECNAAAQGIYPERLDQVVDLACVDTLDVGPTTTVAAPSRLAGGRLEERREVRASGDLRSLDLDIVPTRVSQVFRDSTSISDDLPAEREVRGGVHSRSVTRDRSRGAWGPRRLNEGSEAAAVAAAVVRTAIRLYPDDCIPTYQPDLDCRDVSRLAFRVTGS